ncbi:hypothetical protein [Hydrogenimonas sp.]
MKPLPSSTHPNIFLVRSPLQALNAIEAKAYFAPDEYNILIVCYRKSYDKALIKRIIELAPQWSEIHFFPLKPHLSLFHSFRRLLKRFPKVKYCMIGDYSHLINYYMNRLHYRDLIMLDDGTGTVYRAHQIQNRTLHTTHKTRFHAKSILSIWLNRLFGIDERYLYKVTLFTIYKELAQDTQLPIIYNRYRFLQNKTFTKPQRRTVYFLGSRIQEWFTDRTKFSEYLKSIVRYYQEQDIQFFYILHRKEEEGHIAEMAKQLEFEYVRFENIIEVELLQTDTLPMEIATFVSTGVTTLKTLYPNLIYTFFSPRH